MRTEQKIDKALGIIQGLANEQSCVVSHPDADGVCQRPATRTVWHLPFCEVHGEEAELAARTELYDAAAVSVELIADPVADGPLSANPFLEDALEQAVNFPDGLDLPEAHHKMLP